MVVCTERENTYVFVIGYLPNFMFLPPFSSKMYINQLFKQNVLTADSNMLTHLQAAPLITQNSWHNAFKTLHMIHTDQCKMRMLTQARNNRDWVVRLLSLHKFHVQYLYILTAIYVLHMVLDICFVTNRKTWNWPKTRARFLKKCTA